MIKGIDQTVLVIIGLCSCSVALHARGEVPPPPPPPGPDGSMGEWLGSGPLFDFLHMWGWDLPPSGHGFYGEDFGGGSGSGGSGGVGDSGGGSNGDPFGNPDDTTKHKPTGHIWITDDQPGDFSPVGCSCEEDVVGPGPVPPISTCTCSYWFSSGSEPPPGRLCRDDVIIGHCRGRLLSSCAARRGRRVWQRCE